MNVRSHFYFAIHWWHSLNGRIRIRVFLASKFCLKLSLLLVLKLFSNVNANIKLGESSLDDPFVKSMINNEIHLYGKVKENPLLWTRIFSMVTVITILLLMNVWWSLTKSWPIKAFVSSILENGVSSRCSIHFNRLELIPWNQ